MDHVIPTSRAAASADIPDLVTELGGDADRLLSQVGLTRHDLADPEVQIPVAALGRLLSEAADATGCNHFGALLGARRDLRTYFGSLGRLVWAAPDLGTATREFVGHIAVHVGGSRWALDVDGELGRLRNFFDAGLPDEHAIAHNLVLLTRLLRALSANRWSPHLIHFSCRQPSSTQLMRRIFSCPLIFNSNFNGIVFHSSDLDTPLPTADEQLSGILHRHGEFASNEKPVDLEDEVEKLIEKNLIAGACSIDSLVRFLPYSRSTLQQKLADRGTTYQQILDRVRARRAKHYLLSSDVSIAELSDLLGYKNPEVLSRAFKLWLGESPSTWRRRNRRPIMQASLEVR